MEVADLADDPSVTVYCAGVGGSPDRLLTAGGRVLAVTGRGSSIAAACATLATIASVQIQQLQTLRAHTFREARQP